LSTISNILVTDDEDDWAQQHLKLLFYWSQIHLQEGNLDHAHQNFITLISNKRLL